jgi:hypothetical protein
MNKKLYRSLTTELEELERTDPEVRAARERYDRMVERITTGLSYEDLRRIYDLEEEDGS